MQVVKIAIIVLASIAFGHPMIGGTPYENQVDLIEKMNRGRYSTSSDDYTIEISQDTTTQSTNFVSDQSTTFAQSTDVEVTRMNMDQFRPKPENKPRQPHSSRPIPIPGYIGY